MSCQVFFSPASRGRRAVCLSLCLLVALFLFSSCKGKGGGDTPTPPEPPAPSAKALCLNISPDGWDLRATDNSFEESDQVGLFVVNYSDGKSSTLADRGNHLNNVCYRYTSGSWRSDKQYYWKDQSTKADLYCYYPYDAEVTKSGVSSYSFTVASDQSSREHYGGSDFMYGVARGVTPTSDPVKIRVNHRLSSLLIYLKCEGGYSDEEMAGASIKVNGVRPTAVINLRDGSLMSSGTPTSLIPYHDGDHYSVLLPPQSVEAEDFISVEVLGTTYRLPKTMTLEPNKRYTCTVTIKRLAGGIDIGIGGWETDDVDNGGSAE